MYRQYRRTAHYNVTHRKRQKFYALPSHHWQMLATEPFALLDTFNNIDDAIDTNAVVANAIVSCGVDAFGLQLGPQAGGELNWHDAATPNDIGKAHSTIRQFYRDWSKEGLAERRACYEPILTDLDRAFADIERSKVQVLVPGAGLGRLVFEICRRGFSAEGNEISWHQLLASSWILNHTNHEAQYPLFPFALQFTNLVSRSHQLFQTHIPDIHPSTSLAEAANNGFKTGDMSMIAADFVAYYSSPSQSSKFDVVVTVFFIDTASNVLQYIETVKNCLKRGGIWINLGPLHWHFDSREASSQNVKRESYNGKENVIDIAEHGSIEFTDEEIRLLLERMGFQIEQHEVESQHIGYIQNPYSMLQDTFRVSHWVAKHVK